MPAPRSRRSTRMNPPPAPIPEDDGLEVVEPHGDEYTAQIVEIDGDGDGAEAEAEGEDSGRSSRRGRAGARGSKRMSASERRRTSRGSMKKAKNILTPAEKAKRRAAHLLVVKLLLGVGIGFGTAFALWWFVLRVDERESIARQSLSQTETMINGIETAISIGDPASAEKKRTEAIAILEIKELAFAKPGFDPNDPLLASPLLANQAVAVQERLNGDLKTRIERAERDLRAGSNLRRIQSGFSRVTGTNAFDDAQLAVFEREVQDFLDNPVLPGAGANADYQAEYADQIKTIKFEVIKIDTEKTRRESAITDVPVREARAQSAILVKQTKFQEALATVDELQRKFQNADFTGVRQYIGDAARLAWESTSATAAQHWITHEAPGTTPAFAETAKFAAQRLMQAVVDTYGMPEYVDKAQALLNTYR